MTESLPIITLRPREGRRLRSGAPWAFSNEIVMNGAAKALPPGSLVTLADEKGAPLATGYFNSKSLIAVRTLAAPRAEIGRDFLLVKLKNALALRERLYDAPFYRLVHAEGDDLPGLVIDRFGPACVVQITTAGMERLLPDLLAALDVAIAPETVVLRNDAPARAHEGLETYVRAVKGDATRVAVAENGARYLADPLQGQKSGWYYDQRDNRAFMAQFANGARVLDAYCYAGGFAVLAARHGAQTVVGIDSSESALQLAREAAAANDVNAVCRFVKGDVFAEFEKRAGAKESFDIVICDPPPFAPSKKDVEPAARAYRRLSKLAAALTAPGGVLMLASCSHNISEERFSAECAAGLARAKRSARLIRRAGASPDHPVHPMLPETAYLKALVYAVD